MQFLKTLFALFIYFGVALPILAGILGDKWYSWTIAIFVTVIVAGILTLKGITKKMTDKVFGVGKQLAETKMDPDAIQSVLTPQPKSTVECRNCGAQVQLSGNKGVCESCGTKFQ